MKSRFIIAVLAASALLLSGVNAGAASEEAKRHLVRGQAAAEMATVPADYDLAIEEFTKARSLAPDWPDVYYNLAVAQERAGKFGEAADSLKRYLQLAPNAPNAESVRNLIIRLEFKAEQTITDEVALDIFRLLGDSSIWKLTGSTPDADPNAIGSMRFSGRDTERIIITYESGVDSRNVQRNETIRVTPRGKILTFDTIYFLCPDRSRHADGCPVLRRFTLEIVSKRHVRMSVRVASPEIKPYVSATVKNYAYVFEKR